MHQLLLLWDQLFSFSKPSSIGATLEDNSKLLGGEKDPTFSPDKECLSFLQRHLLASLILKVKFA